ncbi:MAG: 30S ribosomal protein S21 [Deltaproteobacteria bacterium]|nr:MAG: 30S ribosomal protein S21 [Deltaproteobacteria bacterium]
MIKVLIRDGEQIERGLKRFKRKVEQSGILKELKKKEYFEKPSEKKKLKTKNALNRVKKKDKKVLKRPTG